MHIHHPTWNTLSSQNCPQRGPNRDSAEVRYLRKSSNSRKRKGYAIKPLLRFQWAIDDRWCFLSKHVPFHELNSEHDLITHLTESPWHFTSKSPQAFKIHAWANVCLEHKLFIIHKHERAKTINIFLCEIRLCPWDIAPPYTPDQRALLASGYDTPIFHAM